MKRIMMVIAVTMLTMTNTAYGQKLLLLQKAQPDTFAFVAGVKDSVGVKTTYKFSFADLRTWINASAAPGGLNTWVQINRAGVFGGSPNFYYDSVNGIAKEQFNNAPNTKTGLTVNGTAQVDSINAPNGFYLPNEKGHGNGVATIDNYGKVSWGVSSSGTVASYDSTGIHASVNPFLSYTVPAGTHHLLYVGGVVNITAAGGATVYFELQYQDETNTSQAPNISNTQTSIISSVTSFTSAGKYYISPVPIWAFGGTAVKVVILVSGGTPTLSAAAVIDLKQ